LNRKYRFSWKDKPIRGKKPGASYMQKGSEIEFSSLAEED